MTKNAGKQKLVRDISANTLQTGITQVFGLIVFYLTSKYLSKDDFGEFNWAVAMGSTIIALASLGLDLVFVKRVASGENVLLISGIHFFHTVLIALVLCALAFGLNLLFPSFGSLHPLFFLVFVNLALSNIANSFKLCLNGLESYRQLALLALCSNVFKLTVILALYINGHFTIVNVVLAYMATSIVEFLLGYLLVNKGVGKVVKPVFNGSLYKALILESLPQLGVVVFDSALARIDWILLGIISSAAATADYSFVYRIFELSKFPLLVVAPILLTRFSKLFVNPEDIDDRNRDEIKMFFKLELFLLMFIPIVLICAWSPLMDYFTDNKYGQVNEVNYWILAPCVPLMCIINFLWTLGFVQGQLKSIMFITIGVSILNIVTNSVLIPFYGQLGASIAFLTSTIVQLTLYLIFIKQVQLKLDVKSSFITIANAIVAVVAAKLSSNNIIFTCFIALGIHIALAFITQQVNIKELKKVIRKQV